MINTVFAQYRILLRPFGIVCLIRSRSNREVRERGSVCELDFSRKEIIHDATGLFRAGGGRVGIFRAESRPGDR